MLHFHIQYNSLLNITNDAGRLATKEWLIKYVVLHMAGQEIVIKFNES